MPGVLLPGGLTVQRILRYYTPIPEFDYWITTARLPYYKAFDVRVFWQQHNEHRILFPQIIFACDYILLHGRQVLPIALSFLCYFGNWVALSWAFWSARTMPLFLRAIGVLLAGIVIGWQGSTVVLAFPLLLQWTLAQFTALLSLLFLRELRGTRNKQYLAACIISAVVATYSSGIGLTLWPILLGAGVLLSIRTREMIALVCSAALSIAGYFTGYEFMGSPPMGKLFLHPVFLLEFIASYLSVPFGFSEPAWLGVCLGIINLAGAALLAIIAVRRRVLRYRTGIVLFGSYAFIILSAVLIAAGQMNLKDSDFLDAKQSRYLVGPQAAWAILLLLVIWVMSHFRRATIVPYAIAALSAVLFLSGFLRLRPWLEEQNKTLQILNLPHLQWNVTCLIRG